MGILNGCDNLLIGWLMIKVVGLPFPAHPSVSSAEGVGAANGKHAGPSAALLIAVKHGNYRLVHASSPVRAETCSGVSSDESLRMLWV